MTYITIPELHAVFMNCEQKITTDTRKIEHGSIFFALKGEHFDANTFVNSAIEQGCSFAVTDCEEYAIENKILLVKDVLESLQQLAKYHRSQLGIPVIGITGSNGKTTNKELIHAVLSQKYKVYATKGNLNNHIGVPLTLLSVTPQHEMAIVEMGANHQGEIDLLSHIADPDYGVITNIGKAHLEGFGGIEGIKKGKSELYRYLEYKNGLVFINGDDPVLMALKNNLRTFVYGEKKEFDVHGQLLSNSEYVEFKWATKHQSEDDQSLVKTKMFGHYNFINLLCAAAIGNYFKVDEKGINSALETYSPEMNRSQVVKTSANTLILDAYNANPSSMALAIENFSKQHFDHKLVILGDMLELGEHAKEEHEAILKKLHDYKVEEAWLVGNLFYEFKPLYGAYHFFQNTSEVVSYLNQKAVKAKTILIKGSRGIKLEGVANYL